MFDNLKGMQAVASLLKNKDKLADAGVRLKQFAEELRVTGQAGGGACRVTATGKMRIVEVVFDPALAAGMAVDDKTRELAGSLVCDAVNDALELAQAALQDRIEREAADLGMPELGSQLGGLLT